MTKEDEIKNEVVVAVENTAVESIVPTENVDVVVPPVTATEKVFPTRNDRDRKGGRGRGGRPTRRGSFERVKPEFDQKMISIRRVTRVMAGGRRFSFSVAVIIGDRKGSVGVGTGKAGDTSLAIEKAFRDAKKGLLKIKLTKNISIPHEIMAKYSSATVSLKPNKGKGLVVGSATRIALELAGVKDVTAKILSGSKNKLNIARATVLALSKLQPPREKAEAVATAQTEEKKTE